MYGSHPFYLEIRENSSLSHGVFMLNSNAMDIIIKPQSLTYKMTGGIIDLTLFLGPSSEQVIQQYQEVIGYHFWINS